MPIRRIAVSAVVAAGIAALPLSAARAQYYPPCSPFPLAWPFCVAGAVVGTAGAIVAAPFQAAAVGPYYYSYAPPYYHAPAYYPPHHHYVRHHAPKSHKVSAHPPQAQATQPLPPAAPAQQPPQAQPAQQ